MMNSDNILCIRNMNKSALFLPLLGVVPQLANAQKPNVILILADDMGYGDVSSLNPESKIHTENIDALGRCGITFTDAHASSSLSTPSRYSIVTGRYSWRTEMKYGVYDGYHQGAMINEGRSTIATMFSKSGYDTACFGKWHLGWNWTLKENAKNNKDVDFTKPVTNGVTTRGGFDHFFGIVASLDMPPYVYVKDDMPTAVPDRIAEKMTGTKLFRSGPIAPDFKPEECLEKFFDCSIDYVNGHKDSDRPFFLYMPLNAPHTPILPSKEYEGRSGIGPYGDYILMVDDLIGKLVRTLKDNGQWENTILVFTTDNGCAPAIDISVLENQGHYPSYIYRGYKTDIYEGGHRLPLIVTYGSRYKGTTDDSLICLSDFFATFADMTGYELQDNEAEDSFSFWNILSGKGKGTRKDLVTLSGKGALAYREKDSKLIFYAGSGGQSYPNAQQLEGLPEMQLYDLSKDPSEKTNLIGDKKYRRMIRKFSRKMREYVDNGRSTPGAPQSNEGEKEWEFTKLF